MNWLAFFWVIDAVLATSAWYMAYKVMREGRQYFYPQEATLAWGLLCLIVILSAVLAGLSL